MINHVGKCYDCSGTGITPEKSPAGFDNGKPGSRCGYCKGSGFDVDHTDDIACPYCGYIHRDSWESPDNSDDMQCEECEKRFAYDSETTRAFTSRRVDCLNGQPHTWKACGFTGYPNARRCTQCERTEWKPKEGQ